MTYQLNVPMNWSEFKKLPTNIQKMYIERLVKKYSVGATKLAEMFGVSGVSVYNFCNKPEIGIKFPKGRRMSEEQLENFYDFIGMVKDKTPIMNACDSEEEAKVECATEIKDKESVEEVVEKVEQKEIECQEDQNFEPNQDDDARIVAVEESPHSEEDVKAVSGIDVSPMMLNSFNLSLNGRFEKDMLFNSLAYMIPEGSNVKIQINCEIMA